MENWKEIPGTNYEVSDCGNIRSTNYHREKRIKNINLFKFGKYYSVRLCINSKKMCFFVHRLVAQAFIPNPDNKPCIDHIDGNPENNRVENLRWVTYKENSNNPISKKRLVESKLGEKCNWFGKFGKDNHNSIPILQMTKNNRMVAEFDSIMDAERLLGYDHSGIVMCCKRKIKSYKGFVWRYKRDITD